MKIEITLKDSGIVNDALEQHFEDFTVEGIEEDELEAVREKRKEKVAELCGKWFEYGEYLTVIVDTKKETCVVKEVE